MVVRGNVRVSIFDTEMEGLIRNFKIGILYQLQKEGYITEEQLDRMIDDINSETSAYGNDGDRKDVEIVHVSNAVERRDMVVYM